SFLVTKNKRKKAKAIIREQLDIDIVLKTLNISDNKEVAEIKPDSDDEKTIIDYSAPDIENKDDEEFEHIDNLNNSFEFNNSLQIPYFAIWASFVQGSQSSFSPLHM
ncbi:4669_t:CDS:2, partial [Dentiscutata heterogama]